MGIKLEELEAEVNRLKEQIAELSWAKDYIEIWKLQSKYTHLYHVLKRSEIPALFAQKTPGVLVELEDAGVFEGLEGVKKVFGILLSEKRHNTPGFMGLHMTVNPVIEINRHRTKAKGVWYSHGSVAIMRDGELKALWCLGRYDMEYVKEDGQWKFLKLVYRITYMTPFDKGWVEEPIAVSMGERASRLPGMTPDRPTTYHMPYAPDQLNEFGPPPPEPYGD
ncbi:MAG: nuclear transport factor 2 family protein [Syntrophorhabdales bacterium]|jgi:hypothetical protein